MDRAEYAAALAALNARKPGPNRPQQKFPRGARVHIAKDLSARNMNHFESDVDAIVLYTYEQKFGPGFGPEREPRSYALYLLGDQEKGQHGFHAWYYEDQLTLVDGDTAPGLNFLASLDGLGNHY